MKLNQIYTHLNQISPFTLQEKWDNSGLLVGTQTQEVSQIVVSLDVDSKMIKEAKEGTLFIIHHPLIFGKLTELNFDYYPANLLQELILKKCALVAMHTNFDKTHLNKYVFQKVLGFTLENQEDFLCRVKGEWSYDELTTLLKEKLNLPMLKVVAKKEKITSISLCTGAGASLMDEVKSDCFLTGDIKYHDATKAVSQDLMMVDIGHYESERFFGEILADELKVLPILVIISNSQNPFHYELG